VNLRAIGDNILCTEADFGDQHTSAGIIIKSTMGKTDGITPRWFHVKSVGPKIDWVKPDQWLYVEYGRWSDGIKVGDETIWKVEPKSCLAISDEKPENTVSIAGNFIEAPKKTR